MKTQSDYLMEKIATMVPPSKRGAYSEKGGERGPNIANQGINSTLSQ